MKIKHPTLNVIKDVEDAAAWLKAGWKSAEKRAKSVEKVVLDKRDDEKQGDES